MGTKKLVVWLVGIGLLVALYAMAGPVLRRQMEAVFSDACQRPVTVESARIVLPAGLRLSGVVVPRARGEDQDPLSVDEIRAGLAPGGLFQGKGWVQLDLAGPRLFMRWDERTRALLSMVRLEGGAGPRAPIQGIRVQRGECVLVDETVVPAFTWDVGALELGLQPGRNSGEIVFELEGVLRGAAGASVGRLQANGSWASAGGFVSTYHGRTRLADGPLEMAVSISHEDLSRLAPYVRQVLGAAPMRGRAELRSRVTVHEGALMIYNELTAWDVAFPPGEMTALDLDGSRLVELLADRDGKIRLDFLVTGKLGEKLDWSDLAAGAMRQALKQAMAGGIQRVLEGAGPQPLEEILQRQRESIGR